MPRLDGVLRLFCTAMIQTLLEQTRNSTFVDLPPRSSSARRSANGRAVAARLGAAAGPAPPAGAVAAAAPRSALPGTSCSGTIGSASSNSSAASAARLKRPSGARNVSQPAGASSASCSDSDHQHRRAAYSTSAASAPCSAGRSPATAHAAARRPSQNPARGRSARCACTRPSLAANIPAADPAAPRTGKSSSNAARESASFLTSRSFKAPPDMGAYNRFSAAASQNYPGLSSL